MMQQRIDRLESLVKTLMAQGQQEPPGLSSSGDNAVWTPDDQATTNDSATLPYRAGTTVINGDHSVYKAANDWSDVLQEVRHIFFLQIPLLYFRN